MVRKKYLRRKKAGRAFEYEPVVEEQRVSRRLLSDIVDRVFDGSAAAVMNAVIDALGPLGITDIDMPASPNKVWAAIQEARS